MKLPLILIATILLSSSCTDSEYPRYSLTTIEYIPDSLKKEHRDYITETIRAASEHMTGGDYEDVDVTIRQAKWTADELFQTSEVGLRKEIDDNTYHNLHIRQRDFTVKEKQIFDSLQLNR